MMMVAFLEEETGAVAILGIVGIVFVVVALILISFRLIRPILAPTIVAFPWDTTNKSKEKQTVILAGSYNPPHLGHLAMLQYLAKRYDTVIAVIGFNPDKHYSVTPEQRVNLLRKMLRDSQAADDKKNNIQVQLVEGYIWRFGKDIGASTLVRGIRSWQKDGRDEQSLQILNTWGPIVLGWTWPIPTLYLEGDPQYNHVSSTLIRNICASTKNKNDDETAAAEEALSQLVPPSTAQLVLELYGTTKD